MIAAALGISLWLSAVLARVVSNLVRKLFRKNKVDKKKMETVTISLEQLQKLTEGALTAEEAREAIIAWAEITRKRKLDMSYKREYNVYEDDHISVYQILPNEMAIYFKDLDQSFVFDFEVGKDVITQDGVDYDTIEDLKVKLDGNTLMTFDGRYI